MLSLIIATGGAVRFDGKSVAGMKPHQVTQRGVARTFQSLRLFLNTTVFENVITATYGRTKATPVEQILRLPRARREEREVREQAQQILSFFGQRLAGYRWNQPAYSLSYANRRRRSPAPWPPSRSCCCSTSPRRG